MRLLRTIFSIAHVITALLLLGMLMNAYVSPAFLPYFNLLPLGFPFLMAAYIALTVLWILMGRKRALLAVLFGLLFIQPARRWVNYSPEQQPGTLKIISFNGKNAAYGESQIHQYLENQGADVILMQEPGINSLKGYHMKRESVVSIASKHKIVNYELMVTGGDNSQAQYADIDINGKTIRFFNYYLEPFYFEKSMVKPSDDASVNEDKARKVISKLLHTFKVHAQQVDALKKMANDSPYPVVIAGDFNAVPNSYEYYTTAEGLEDAFVKAGRGFGTTFHDYKFPLKIDHIFTSETIEAKTYHIDRNIKISDHFPVTATFNIKE